MKVISSLVNKKIRAIVGTERYRSDRRERKMYSFDIGVMPALIKPFVNAGIAGGVARPANEAQIQALVKLATKEHLTIVPRAAATSGYGGVLPRNGALVIDLNSLDQLLSVDTEQLIVRCQAGAIWEKIDKQLADYGLELALHPSSYPSSTVGGWLAQGGSGFGSFEYGSFKEIVISTRVVLPDGSIREFTGEELQDVIADAEGITGIITEVTFRARKKEAQETRLVSFCDAASIASVLIAISEAQLPIWSLTFLNPAAIELKTYLPPRHVHSFEQADADHERALNTSLPVSYLLLIAFPTSRAAAIDEQLNSIVDTAGGTFLPQATAEHEWVGRTAPMRLKRIGPSIIPTEVTVPLSELASTLAEIDSTTKQSLIIEGMSGKGGQVTLLGFIPHDERSFAFNFAFALALSVIQIAKRHQGSAYSTGLYFRSEAQTVLGHEHLTRLQAFKQEVDPANLINPGKVLRIGRGGRVLDALMGIAKALEPLIRPIANAAKAPLPYTVANAARSQLPNGATHSPLPSAANTEHERQRIARSRSLHKVPAEVAYMAIACARCGYCVPTCEQFSVRGWESQSPRGKYAYLREVIAGREKWDRKAIDTFLLCTTCERCNLRCQLHLPVEHNNMLMRGSLIQEEGMGTFPPFEMMAASLRGEGDIWAGKRQHRADWLPEDVATRLTSGNDADILYFAGCTSSYVETDIAEATIRLLLDSGLKVAYLGTQENCCGIPMKMAGKWDLFSQIYADNVALVKQTGAHTIVTSCAACGLVWKELYAEEAAKRGESYDIVSKHYSEIIAPALMDGRIRLTNNPLGGKRVTFHDSCHAGRAQGIYEEPRQMLAAIPGLDIIEMEHNRDQGICCGSVLTLVGDIDKAPCLGKQRLDEAMDIDADTIISLCPCCQVQLRDSVDKHDLPLVIDDLARIVAAAAGYDIPSSAPQTSYMWGLFDVFIRLMAPAEMARFMQRIFPDMIDAMPLKMGPMMRVMIKLPGGAAMMRKMMPLLFPIMAPGILAKVMPRMIEEVQAYVGKMPPDMDELMPELLPKTLDALMPTYLPQLIPYLVPLFIGHLQGKAPIAVKRIPSGSDPLPPDKSLVADDDPLVEKPKVA